MAHPGWSVAGGLVFAVGSATAIASAAGLAIAPVNLMATPGVISHGPIHAAVHTLLVVTAFVLPAASVAVALSEARRIRGLPYFMIVAFGLALVGAIALGKWHDVMAVATLFAMAAIAAYGYWRIAGRYAGRIAARIAAVSDGALDDAALARRCWRCTGISVALGLLAVGLTGWAIVYRSNPTATADVAGLTATNTAVALGLAFPIGIIVGLAIAQLCVRPGSNARANRQIKDLEQRLAALTDDS